MAKERQGKKNRFEISGKFGSNHLLQGKTLLKVKNFSTYTENMSC